MDAFKIENYERDHGVGSFFPFRHVAPDEARSIEAEIKRKLGLPAVTSASDLVKIIFEKSFHINEVNAEGAHFQIDKILRELNFSVSENIFLNWYQFDDIDEIKASDVFSNLSDIWYPSADDLDLIDSRMRWMLLIHHSGTVRALNLDGQ